MMPRTLRVPGSRDLNVFAIVLHPPLLDLASRVGEREEHLFVGHSSRKRLLNDGMTLTRF